MRASDAIRVPGEITREKRDILRLADDVFIAEIRRAGLYDDIWQAFVVILPVTLDLSNCNI